MNRNIFIGIAVSLLLLFSCGQRKEKTYKTHVSEDESYSLEIPVCAVREKCATDFMSFKDNDSHLTICVQSIGDSRIDEHINNKDGTNEGFTYNLFQSSDTTSFYKITRGNNMWLAYELYMLKKLDSQKYIIQVSSDRIGQSEMIEIIRHIYSSMKQYVTEKGKAITKESYQKTALESSFSNKYYTIKYPKGWKKIEHFDEITDVYIGSETENFGFTIVRFETDYTLSEINTDGNESIRLSGVRIKEDKLITLKGLKCYRAIHEISKQNQKVKHISYTFKKGNMLYNIKFGSSTTKTQETLASEIIETFNFK